jgi:hypothetical protein
MSDDAAAQLIAAALLLGLTAWLAVKARRDLVAIQPVSYTYDGTMHKVAPGTVIPRARFGPEAQAENAGRFAERRRSWLGGIIAGTDNRTSTSKTVVFAWTLAVAYGLLSLVLTMIFGDSGPWNAQVEKGWSQEEYLLLLGGPFAAAVLAKYATESRSDAKTVAPVGSANAAQLVSDDDCRTDLADLQYVLFNLIALIYFFGAFVGDLSGGFPDLPALLTGLILTSTTAYTAKKFVESTTPAVTSVLPAAAPPGAEVQVFGTQLGIPSSAAEGVASTTPTVLFGARRAQVRAHDLVLGNDRLTVVVPADAPAKAVRHERAAVRGARSRAARSHPGPAGRRRGRGQRRPLAQGAAVAVGVGSAGLSSTLTSIPAAAAAINMSASAITSAAIACLSLLSDSANDPSPLSNSPAPVSTLADACGVT